jgi:hypothetical protein
VENVGAPTFFIFALYFYTFWLAGKLRVTQEHRLKPVLPGPPI